MVWDDAAEQAGLEREVLMKQEEETNYSILYHPHLILNPTRTRKTLSHTKRRTRITQRNKKPGWHIIKGILDEQSNCQWLVSPYHIDGSIKRLSSIKEIQ